MSNTFGFYRPLEASAHKSRLAPASFTDSFGNLDANPADSPPDLAFVTMGHIPIYDLSGQLVKTLQANETPDWQCVACMKGFATKQSLERHKERHPLCKKWETEHSAPTFKPAFQESVYKWATETLETALRHETPHKIMCKFCKNEFSSVGNLHKHFSNATVCNRLGYNSVFDTFSKACTKILETDQRLPNS